MRDRLVFLSIYTFNLHASSRFTVICKVKIKVKVGSVQLNHYSLIYLISLAKVQRKIINR